MIDDLKMSMVQSRHRFVILFVLVERVGGCIEIVGTNNGLASANRLIFFIRLCEPKARQFKNIQKHVLRKKLRNL